MGNSNTGEFAWRPGSCLAAGMAAALSASSDESEWPAKSHHRLVDHNFRDRTDVTIEYSRHDVRIPGTPDLDEALVTLRFGV